MAAAQVACHTPNLKQRVGGAISVAPGQRQQAAHQRQAHLACHGVVAAAGVFGRHGALGAARHPAFGLRHVARAQQSHHQVHVVERVIAGGGRAHVPARQQQLALRRHVHAQQVQPPQHGHGVDAVQRHLQRLAAEVGVHQPQRTGRVQPFQPEQRLVPPQVPRKPVPLGPHWLLQAQPSRTFVVSTLHFHHMGHGMHRPGHPRVGGQGAAPGFFSLRIKIVFFKAEGV